jgi:hypothetical protein
LKDKAFLIFLETKTHRLSYGPKWDFAASKSLSRPMARSSTTVPLSDW